MSQGYYPIAILAYDDFGGSVSGQFVLNVQNRSPFIANMPQATQNAIIGQTYMFDVSSIFADPDDDEIVYIVTQSNGLPLTSTGWLTYANSIL